MKAAAFGNRNRIRVLASEAVSLTSDDASENDERSIVAAWSALQTSGVARGGGDDNTVTVYGPRRRENGGNEDEKVKATIKVSAERLLVTFHNLDLKGKRKCEEDEQWKPQEDEACEMDIDD